MSDILSKKEIEHFIHSGFIRLDHAFSKELADSALDILDVYKRQVGHQQESSDHRLGSNQNKCRGLNKKTYALQV